MKIRVTTFEYGKSKRVLCKLSYEISVNKRLELSSGRSTLAGISYSIQKTLSL